LSIKKGEHKGTIPVLPILAHYFDGGYTMLKTRRFFLLALMILLFTGAACSPAYEFKGARLEPPAPVPDFELTADNGQPFRLSEANSDISLVYFGYTFCPDVCPLTMVDVRDALAELDPAERERVQVIFISVDPERDTPDVLTRYLAAFDPTFIGLTDDFEKIQAVMKPFGAFAEKEEVEDSVAGYLMSHTARVYLLDADHEILLTYSFGFEPEDLSSDLTYLLNEKT
jgi:protein SCO1/2